MAKKRAKRTHDDGDDEEERSEAKVFFRTVHDVKESTAKEGARLAAATLEISEDKLRPFFAEAIGQAFFRLFSTIDGTGGPDDFPRVELTLEDGDSLNASFLHDLFVEYEPDEQAEEIETAQRQRPPGTRAVVIKDEKQALGMLKAFTKMPGLNVHIHDTYFKKIRVREKKPKGKRKS